MNGVVLWNAADLVIIALLVLFGAWGWHSGLIRTGFRFLSFVISIVLAYLLYPILSEFLKTTVAYDRLFSMAEKQLEAAPAPGETTPFFLRDVIEQGRTALIGSAADYLASLALNLLAFALVLVVVKLLLHIVKKLLHLFASLPVVSLFNHLAGMGLGIAEGILAVLLILAAVTALPQLRENAVLQESVSQSVLCRAVADHNPALRLLLPAKTDEPLLSEPLPNEPNE